MAVSLKTLLLHESSFKPSAWNSEHRSFSRRCCMETFHFHVAFYWNLLLTSHYWWPIITHYDKFKKNYALFRSKENFTSKIRLQLLHGEPRFREDIIMADREQNFKKRDTIRKNWQLTKAFASRLLHSPVKIKISIQLDDYATNIWIKLY